MEKERHLTEAHGIALLKTIFHVAFCLLPFILGLLFIVKQGIKIDFSLFYIKGEFYIYSTSLISSSFFIYYNFKNKINDKISILCLSSLFLLIIIAALYGSHVTSPENIKFIKYSSIVSICISVCLFYYSQLIQSIKSPELTSERDKEVKSIMNEIS